jgi:hypothetical protein
MLFFFVGNRSSVLIVGPGKNGLHGTQIAAKCTN